MRAHTGSVRHSRATNQHQGHQRMDRTGSGLLFLPVRHRRRRSRRRGFFGLRAFIFQHQFCHVTFGKCVVARSAQKMALIVVSQRSGKAGWHCTRDSFSWGSRCHVVQHQILQLPQSISHSCSSSWSNSSSHRRVAREDAFDLHLSPFSRARSFAMSPLPL